ncbi:hypothetical protein UA32_18995 [Photobacterium angustum]|uniref:Uncharacterized protein n=1 Tax=Photobacterium angustum TaxID=661 RepID=A0ABX5H0T5_PHOAN|nr:hypothetical protein [Photobacterium angustum]KJG35798.1 hypothetical protein UA32_18995 [Photobacterium angustum]PSX06702.1 hypothetical protein C0W27_16345 [Photobacterium angustum]
MAKTLCKYRRAEIVDQFATISKIVSEPNFMCSSCTRVASDKEYLCKPSRLTNAVKAAPRVAKLSIPPEPQPMMAMKTPNVHNLPAPTAVGQSYIEMVAVVEEEALAPDSLKLKQAKKLKKLAKKKNKQLKKAAKTVKKFEKQLKKAKLALGL